MSKVTLTKIGSGVATTTLINANYDAIEAAFDNTLSRDGSTPNQMNADIDMNSKYLLNVGRIDAAEIRLNGSDIDDAVAASAAAAASATAAASSATDSASSASNAASSAAIVADWDYEGSWTTATSYKVNNIVTYNGSSYICILDHTSGSWPGTGTYWSLLAEKGASGAGTGDVIGPAGATDSAIALFDGSTGTLLKDSATTLASLETVGTKAVGDVMHPTVRIPLQNSLAGEFAGTLTFTRAGVARHTNRKGIVVEAAADEPRFGKHGLLMEGASTNLSDNTEHPLSWTAITAKVVETGLRFGGIPMSLIYDDDTSASRLVYRNVTIADDANWRGVSLYFKQFASDNDVRFQIQQVGGTTTTDSITVDVVAKTATFTTQTAGVLLGVDELADGVIRVRVVVQNNSSGNTTLRTAVYPAISSNAAIGGVYVGGLQVENIGKLCSSYMPSVETFTGRASSATYWDSNGVLQTAGSGVERAASYDPADLTKEPVQLLEVAATNELTYSEQFDNAAWVKGNTTVTANAAVAPDGATTADKLVETAVAGTHKVAQSVALASSGSYVFSVFAKKGERKFIALRIYNTTDGSVASVLFNLDTGEVDSTFAGIGGIIDCGDYYRLWVAGTSTVSGTHVFEMFIYNDAASGSYTGDGSSGLYVWGAQVEDGVYPTSYIETVGAAASRVADSYTSATGSRVDETLRLTSDDNLRISKGNGFTIMADIVADPGGGTNCNERVFFESGYEDTSVDAFMHCRINVGTDTLQAYRSGGALSVSSFDASSGKRISYRVTEDQAFSLFVDGVREAHNAGPMKLFRDTGHQDPDIGIGCRTYDVLKRPMFGYIRNFRIYDKALSDDAMRIA